jgi:chromosome segregation ATPase
LVSYLLIGVVIAAGVIGYFDIRNRLLSVHSSGSQETQHLSEDLQSKFASLGIKISNLESTLNTLSESHTKTAENVSTLKAELAKTNKTVSNNSSEKADKKSVSSSVSTIKNELASLTESTKKNTAETAILSAKLTTTLTEINTASMKVSEDLNALRAIVDAIQADKASKKDLLTEIDHIENVLKTYQSKTDKQTAAVLQSIQRLDMRTNAIEVKVGLPTSSRGSSDASASQQDSGSGDTSSAAPSSSLPAPGGLIERDISQ